MNRSGVAGFNLLDNNFSRDVSDVSDIRTPLEKHFQRPHNNIFKEVARGRMSMPRYVEGFEALGTPTDVKAKRIGVGDIYLEWVRPITPASPVTEYTITASDGKIKTIRADSSGNSPPPNATFTGLTAGSEYTFTVTAKNALTTSSPSPPSNSVIVYKRPPPQPLGVPGVPSNIEFDLNTRDPVFRWNAPAPGSSPIEEYKITAIRNKPGMYYEQVVSVTDPNEVIGIQGKIRKQAYGFI